MKPSLSLCAVALTFLPLAAYSSMDWAFPSPPATTIAGPLRLLTVLGDSFSDLGSSPDAEISMYKLSNETNYDPKYFPFRRPNNGQAWQDVLSAVPDLHVRSYATSAATICTSHAYRDVIPGMRDGLPNLPSIQQQTQLYLRDASSRPLSSLRGVAIWAGTNDIVSALLNDPDGPEGPLPPVLFAKTGAYLEETLACLTTSIRDLVAAGERNLFLFTLSPLEDTPILSLHSTTIRDSVVLPYIQKLQEAVTQLQQDLPEASIHLYDLYSRAKSFLAPEANPLGLRDLNQPCLVATTPFGMAQNPLVLAKEPCSNADDHVFVDFIHYSSRVQTEVVGRGFLELLVRAGYVKAGADL